jgi:hypothetical protein
MRKSFTFAFQFKFFIISTLSMCFLSNINAQVSGTVFSDFNASGAKENTATYNEPFVAGTTVIATLADGTSFTTTTDANGAYSFSAGQIPSGIAVRIEFIDAVSSSKTGTSNGSNVQFTTGGSTDINYAINSPDDYWDNINTPTPSLMVVHHNRGTANNSAYGGQKALLHTDNSASGPNAPTSSTEVTIDTTKRPAINYEVGSTFSLAYHLKQQRFIQAAFMKRMSGFGPKGTGGLYIMDKSGGTWDYAASFSLNGVTPSNGGGVLSFGSVTRTTTPGTNAATANYISPINGQWTLPKGSDGRDNDAFFKVGRMSIGGIEVDRCEDTLFVVNIFQRKLITVDISGTSASLNNASAATLDPLTKAYDLVSLPGYPAALATGDTVRPFGLKFYRGKAYLGVVNDAMGSQSVAKLKGYILQFDPHNIAAGFTTVLTINFDQYADNFWKPWLSTWAQTGGTNSSGPVTYPQPMITDIEFNEDGSMDIGIRDRWGDQGGSFEFWPVTTPSTTANHTQTVALGDVLHVCKVNGVWFIEGTSGSCTQLLTNNSDLNGSVGWTSSYGSNGKEYYGDHAGDDNPENGFGGLAKLMGSKKLASTCLDPMIDGASAGSNYWSTSGVKWNSNTTGKQEQIARCLGGDFNNFDKANSLGDLEFVQECPKIQIGNRLWVDTDNDGVQDAGETPIVAATVELVGPGTDGNFGTSDDVVLASTTTDPTGHYYFSTTTTPDSRKPSTWTGIGTNDIVPGFNYQVRVPLGQTAITSNNYQVTTDNINTNGSDNIDSDGTSITIGTDSYSAVNFNTNVTNHNFDFGFKIGCNLTASATGMNVSCNAGTNGTATATPSGNLSAVTYVWSNGATTATISNLTAGTYTVTVTESVNCTATANYTVTEPSDITLACAKTDATTNGGNDGTATITATGGTSPNTYLWSNGATTASITGLTAGTYTVTVTDANGCSDVCSSQVNEPGCNLTASATGTNVTCNTGTNGTATATPSGNLSPVTYVWSNGATTATISNLTAGTYTVTVTESVNCTATANYTVTEPSDITLACAKTDVTTSGGNNGTATVTATGGTSPYTYLWSNGATTASITSLTAGTYTVTVTDANGCSDVCSSQVNEPGCNLTASATGTNVSCNAGTNGTATATPSGNLSPVTYVWSNGATTASITTLAAGTYNVTIAESVNCTATANYTVTEPSDITLACAKTDVTTTGGNNGTATVTVTGGTNPYTYLWSNGATTASITGLTAGTYTVTVTDANGCSDVCSSQVNEPGCNLTASATGTNVSCNAGTNGTATVTPSGNLSPVTYVWSNGATTASITTLVTGTYNVTVTESANCTATANYTVTEPLDITLACAKTDVTTTGGSNGTASVTATGGTSPYTYLWSNGATTASITGLTAGTYTVTVTDANGCADVCSSQVNEPGCNLTASATGTNVSCNAGTNGTATATPSGNLSPVTYAWSNGATTATISNLTAGTYTVTVTESVNCTATASYTVTEPSDITLACAKTDATTTGGSNGTATVTATGGTSPYTYLWSNGATTASITSLTAGTYTVTVTDANGCSDVCSSTIVEPGCTQPTVGTNTPIEGTCTSAIANDDAQIEFTGFTNADKADKVIGATYTAVAYNTATLTVTAGAITVTGLKHNTQYTFRFWNGADNCYIDVTVTTPIKTCTIPCPNPNCGTLSVRKL